MTLTKIIKCTVYQNIVPQITDAKRDISASYRCSLFGNINSTGQVSYVTSLLLR